MSAKEDKVKGMAKKKLNVSSEELDGWFREGAKDAAKEAAEHAKAKPKFDHTKGEGVEEIHDDSALED